MTIDLLKLSNAQLETLMDNAQASAKPEASKVYREAAVELFRRRGSDYTDPVIAGCHGALALLDRCRFEKTGKRLKSNYSLRSIRNNGEIAFMTDCALGNTQGTGFQILVENGLGTCTVEYLVATHPERFPAAAVASARARLTDSGVTLPA
ncbi:hypothetical protein [Methylobacterium frigidaeris]|uniref:Uncharacterized protein n=1 Tax=Methylobacterium frigidaeris TaxID=2038277 RepID=A0AA37M8K2_9HYPH|nr:hypothetical protein [Methylobacterium frigidaeris]PIK71279.1 hypothetical protein CS379_20195 [Methylobacterium frigidaeris]GJD66247.1 hypothetical protein MPEAHAMD_6444 [Methylobacterium frigidaeris]